MIKHFIWAGSSFESKGFANHVVRLTCTNSVEKDVVIQSWVSWYKSNLSSLFRGHLESAILLAKSTKSTMSYVVWLFPIQCMCVLSQSVMSNSLESHGLYQKGSSVPGIFQARILQWVVISFFFFLFNGS